MQKKDTGSWEEATTIVQDRAVWRQPISHTILHAKGQTGVQFTKFNLIYGF